MNTYSHYFHKFSYFSKIEFDSIHDFFDKVISSLDSFSFDSKVGEAIIIVGYSGNGKTTWIDHFIHNNPTYEVVSMDSVTRELTDREGNSFDSEHLIVSFGNLLEEKCNSGKNIIIDGRFLNLLTRLSLTQTLHSYQYRVGVVDLTDDILSILPFRIMDYCGRDMGVKINSSNISKYSSEPRFQRRYQHIMNYYQYEKNSCFYDEQKEYGIQYTDCDFIVDKDNYSIISNRYK